MNFFRLIWWNGTPSNTSRYECSQNFEVLGDHEAIFQFWLLLGGRQSHLAPHFCEVYNKEGKILGLTKGINHMLSQ